MANPNFPNAGVKRDFFQTSTLTSNNVILPTIKNVSQSSPAQPGKLVLETDSQNLFYSTGLEWMEVSSASLFVDSPLDYIIVGGGTAGLTCAWGLTNESSVAGLGVLVVECGENLVNDSAVLDPTLGSSQLLTYDTKYARAIATLTTDVYSEGVLLGGGSAHNGMQAVRGTPDIYNSWASITGNNRWLYSNLLPLLLNQEHYTPTGTVANPAQRGLSGRLFITQEAPLTDAFSNAIAAGLGVPMITDYNNHTLISPGVYANQVGVSANQDYITPTSSVRSFSGNSYLYGIPAQGIAPIVDTDGNGLNGRKLFVRVKSSVSRVIFAGTTAIGVEILVNDGQSNKIQLAFANKGIILSAGSFMSPAILQRSGIGASSLLTSLNIPVLVNNANVGANMINQYGPNALIRRFTGGAPPPTFKLNVAFSDLGINDDVRRVQTDFLYPGSVFFPAAIRDALNLSSADSVSMGGLLLRPNSRGSVTIRSTNPVIHPLVNLGNYTDGPYTTPGTDLANAVTYLKQMVDIINTGGGNPATDMLYPPISHYPAPYGPAANDALLAADAQSGVFNSYHCVGTCRMGTNVSNGVVDGNLKVFGVNNLYVADCSIEPLVQTGNTAYMAFFIGLMMAKILGANLP